MIFDLDNLKNTFKTSINSYISPYQNDHPHSISLYTSGTITETFIPFSSSITTGSIYISNTIGTPDKVTISLSGPGVSSSKTLSLEEGWNTINWSLNDLVTYKRHTLSITGGVSSSDDYYFGYSSINSYFYGSMATDKVLTFGFNTGDHVFKMFPSREIGLDEYPIVVLDLRGRPRVRDRYISGDFLWEYINLGVEIYSRYSTEIDLLSKGIERGLVKNRKNFTGIQYITPGRLGDLSFLSSEIFFRDLSYTLMCLVSRE